MRFAEIDAVTLDAHGTLVSLVDPVPKLRRLLAGRGIERSDSHVGRAFAAEAAYYTPRSYTGRDADSLARLQRDCVAVFLDELGADLDPADFAPEYVAALEFALEPGVAETLAALRARGLTLAVVSNWDCTLPAHLAAVGVAHLLSAIATSAAAGVAKPDPRIFTVALERVGVAPERAVHVGDNPADSDGAAAAGLAFLPAPLRAAFAGWQ